jgi:glycosyltransferase involved in cell wall biosynthesis
MEKTVESSKKTCYFFVRAENQFNSIRIQIDRISLIIESLYHYRCVVVHPGIDNYQSQLSEIISNNELLFWHFGGLDFNLSLFKNYNNVYFIYHNITPACFFWNYDPLVSIRSILGRIQLKFLNKKIKWLAVSEYNAVELKKIGFQNVSVLPNIVSISELNLSVTKKSINPSIIFVSRISPSKGSIKLLKNLKKLVDLKKSKLVLNIVGDVKIGCKYGLKFIKNINDLRSNEYLEINWYKSLSVENLNNLYSESWLYVSMSRHEGFGLPACESILYDTPALYLSSGGQESVLNSLGLIESNDDAFFINTIDTHLSDSILRNDLLVMQKNQISPYLLNNWISKNQKALDKIFHFKI